MRGKRGGARFGAGRPRAGTVQITVRVKPETATFIRRRAKNKKTLGRVVDDLAAMGALV